MDPASLIPLPDAIPIPYVWFNLLLVIMFALHILLINAVLGLTGIALFSSQARDYLSRDLATTLMALAVNVGVAVLLFIQALYGNLFYASSLLMAWWWMGAVCAAILGYAGLYGLKYKWGEGSGWLGVISLCSPLLLLATGFVLANNVSLMLTPAAWSAYFQNPGGTLLALDNPALWPRYAHFLLACPAAGGLALALAKRKGHGPEAKRAVSFGLKLFSHATLLQFAVGSWYLMSLPREIMQFLMSGAGYGAWLLLAGVGLGVFSLACGYTNQPRAAATLLLLTVLDMAWLRDVVRKAYLAPYFSAESLPLKPEYSSFAIFSLALAGLLLLFVYLNKRYQAKREF